MRRSVILLMLPLAFAASSLADDEPHDKTAQTKPAINAAEPPEAIVLDPRLSSQKTPKPRCPKTNRACRPTLSVDAMSPGQARVALTMIMLSASRECREKTCSVRPTTARSP